MTVAELRSAQERLGFTDRGMAEILGVTLDVFKSMRSYRDKLLPGDAIVERIGNAEKLRQMREGK